MDNHYPARYYRWNIMNKKFIIYVVGIITGIGLSFLYFQSSTSDNFSHYQKQLMEKSKEVETLSKKSTEFARQINSLTEENSELLGNNTNLELQVYEYKERDKAKAEKKRYFR